MTNTSIYQGALQCGDTAEGLRFLRPGFGLTKEDDRLYALGWPYLMLLEPGDAKPETLDDAAEFTKTYLFEQGVCPAGVAPRMLRGLYALRNEEVELDAIRRDDPIGAKERDALFDFVLTEEFSFVSTFLLEALFGSRVVIDAIIERISAVAPEKWQRGPFERCGGGCAAALHFLLLRTDAAHAKAARKKLVVLHARVKSEGSRAAGALDTAINGRAGVERSGWRDDHELLQNDVMYALDDPEFIHDRALEFVPKIRSGDRVYPCARVAFLGGDDVIDAIADNTKGVHTSQRQFVATGFSRCAHPRAAEIMSAMTSARGPTKAARKKRGT